VELVGRSPDQRNPSGLFTQVEQEATGDAGDLTIETARLTVLNGAQISSSTIRNGQGGTLTINASDSIQLSGASPTATLILGRSGIFVSAEPGATGNVGALKISTGQLTVENGAEISANNSGTGNGGTATLNTRQLIIRDGGWVGAGSRGEGSGGILTVNATEFVQVSGTGTIGSDQVASTLFTQANSSGEAGDLNITTRSLNVRDGARVSVSGEGTGPAGNMTIKASSIRLDQGRLTAETKAEPQAESGANINLQDLDLLLMRDQSLISLPMLLKVGEATFKLRLKASLG
jgi:large exoprotein involved in heme utilization and adhesion